MSDTTSGERARRRTRRLAALASTALALAATTIVAAPASAFAPPPAAVITIEATPAEATEGDTIQVVVTAASVTDLYAYDLAIAFDPALLAFVDDSATGPDGGFTSAVPTADGITVSHTRLGTSPGLTTGENTPTVQLAAFSFTALGGGDATIALSTVRLVNSFDETIDLAEVDTATVTLTALPDPEPSPEPTSSPTPSPTAPVGAGAGTSTPLATTGADAAPWLITGAVAVAVIAAGTLFVIRRRRAVSE